MAQINHNISTPNDDLGDQLRTAFGNQNTMNTDLYANKVDKVGGKDLSTNDFTNTLKTKLDGIAAGAEVNVQSDWEQADNTADDYIKNKPAELFSSVGSFHYVDLATQTTPLTVVASVEKKITNDTASTETNVLNAPYGITTMWDVANNQLDFTQTAVGDLVTIIPAIEVTTTIANQNVKIYIKLGIGSSNPTTKQVFNTPIKAIGSVIINPTSDFVIDTLDIKDYPAEIFILSDDAATVESGALDIKVVRKDINVYDLGANAGIMAATMHGAFNKTTLVDADEITGTDSDADWALIRVSCLNLWNYIKSKAATVFQYKLVAGTNISIDNTNPLAPVISASGAGSSETTTTMGALINSATAATPNDTDLVATAESAGLLKKITWTNVKAFLKTYFDTLYQSVLVSGANIKTVNSASLLGSGNIVITGSGARIYNVKDYGALGNGSTDDTSAIQTTINTCFAAGGGVVYFPIGVYIVGGALLNDVGTNLVDYNSQLYIPYEIHTSATRRTVELLGEVAPNLFQSLGVGGYTAPNSGVILRSTIQGSGTRPSVIANSGINATGGNGFNYTTSYFKNLSIQITPNGSSKVTIGAINCENAAIANFENITAFPYNVALPSTGKPDVIDVVGIAMPKINCEHINTITRCSVGGFTHGYLLGEHTSAYDAVAICCVNSFTQGESYHLGNYNKLSSFWSIVDFNIIGVANSFFNVQNLQVEWQSTGKWYDSVTTISDSANLGQGKIKHNIIEPGGFAINRFKKIGGLNLEVSPTSILSSINAITATSYTIVYSDAFRLNTFSNASDITITIPPYSSVNFDINARLLIKRKGVGRVILAAGSGVTFESPAGYYLELNAQYNAVELVQESINVWSVFGALKPI